MKTSPNSDSGNGARVPPWVTQYVLIPIVGFGLVTGSGWLVKTTVALSRQMITLERDHSALDRRLDSMYRDEVLPQWSDLQTCRDQIRELEAIFGGVKFRLDILEAWRAEVTKLSHSPPKPTPYHSPTPTRILPK